MTDKTRDLIVEFFGVAFHNILYHSHIYPSSIYEPRKKYGVFVYQSIHPDLNKYIECCLRSIAELLKCDGLNRVEFNISNKNGESKTNFVFELGKPKTHEKKEFKDVYLIECEQNLRAFCLKLASVDMMFDGIDEHCSFQILLHTNQSSAVAMARNQELEDFPFIEVLENEDNSRQILPIKSLQFQQTAVQIFVEKPIDENGK